MDPILLLGSGGREHALAARMAESGRPIVCAPGNAGIAAVARVEPVAAEDPAAVTRLAAALDARLVVVGPEAPLVAGVADALRDAGLDVFGPGRAAARTEGSKAFAKELMARAGIPTAAFSVCTTMAEVRATLARHPARLVVKADGLCAGKGVVVADHAAEAEAAAREMLEEDRFGAAGRTLVLEERLAGREVSLLGLTDGERVVVLPSVEDHKRLGDGDSGPNTGGMGTYSPSSLLGRADEERLGGEALAPALRRLADDGTPFRGVLFAGLMMTAQGPRVLEYNCRFGDPETQAILARWRGDLVRWLEGAARGRLPDGEPELDPRPSVCVVLASAGYPARSSAPVPISGLAEAGALADVRVFHAGTARADGAVVTAGGRVLGVTALGADLVAARARAYEAVARIRFEGMQYRRDIAEKGLVP